MDRKCELLKDELTSLEGGELREFINHFDTADAGAYTWALWGAAYVMSGGCSDDSFSDFRATLISHGRDFYERSLADPDSLAELTFEDEEDVCYEGFQYVKNDVAEEKLGEIPNRVVSFPDEPSGEAWEEDSVDQLFPKLAVKYSGGFDRAASSRPKKPWWKFW